MTERDSLEALAELVAPFDDDPNAWDDVLRRAQLQPATNNQSASVSAPTPPAAPRARPRRRWSSLDRWQVRTAVGVLAAAAVIATPPRPRRRRVGRWHARARGARGSSHPPRAIRGGARRAQAVICDRHLRAPDGARYELVLDRYPDKTTIADGEQVDSCLALNGPTLASPAPRASAAPASRRPKPAAARPAACRRAPSGSSAPTPKPPATWRWSASPIPVSSASKSPTQAPTARARTHQST